MIVTYPSCTQAVTALIRNRLKQLVERITVSQGQINSVVTLPREDTGEIKP